MLLASSNFPYAK